jgi:hypothetical protein
VQQCLEQHLAFPLRTEIEVRGGIRQREQLGQQRNFLVAMRTRPKKRPQLAELLFDRIVTRLDEDAKGDGDYVHFN